MGKVPNLVHEANVWGRNKPQLVKPVYKPSVDNKPTRAEIIERLRALESDPDGQQVFFEAVTQGWDHDDKWNLIEEAGRD